MSDRILKSFAPLVDRHSKVLILGTMPGPVALAKKEYYGFTGNHFWRIVADLFPGTAFQGYADKVRALKDNGIALWDVIGVCRRRGASDGNIRILQLNDIPGVVARFPKIQRIFLNGGLAEKVYRAEFENKVPLPAVRLPSTSPANARIPYREKLRRWAVVKKATRSVYTLSRRPRN